jgi:raffinose/stachyose/melibiose transport system permease protein
MVANLRPARERRYAPAGGGRRASRTVRAGRLGRSRQQGLTWILPALVVSVGLVYYCIGYTGYISTLNWDGVSPDKISVGLHNYAQLYHDFVFWKTLEHTAVFFVITFAAQIVFGMGFAILMHSRIRLAAVYKVIIFVPVVLAPATMAPVFREIFSPDGQFNTVLKAVGLGSLAQPWLAQTSTALGVIIAIAIWQSTGVAFILYFAAMSQIDTEVMEAARLDGAGNFHVIYHIIWPSVRGTTIALSILSAISSLKLFDIPYLVSSGGPDYATEFLGTFIYRVSVPQSQVGYGAALSIMLLILALTVAVVFSLRARGRGSANV